MRQYVGKIVAILCYAIAYIRQLLKFYANIAPKLLLIYVECWKENFDLKQYTCFVELKTLKNSFCIIDLLRFERLSIKVSWR